MWGSPSRDRARAHISYFNSTMSHLYAKFLKCFTCDLLLSLSRISFLQQLQGLSNSSAVLNLHLVALMLKHQIPQSSGSSLVHCRIGAPQQGNKSRNTLQLGNLWQRNVGGNTWGAFTGVVLHWQQRKLQVISQVQWKIRPPPFPSRQVRWRSLQSVTLGVYVLYVLQYVNNRRVQARFFFGGRVCSWSNNSKSM